MQGTVFVAGGTGGVGFRVVQLLAKRGVPVRVGCRDTSKGQRMVTEKIVSGDRDNVTCVSFDVTKDDEVMNSALGDAETVVSAMGIGEGEFKNVFGPYQVDGKGTTRLVNVAREKNVKKFVLVTSLGTGTPFKWPTALFNLFWGLLVWKKKGEDALIDSRINFTIVRPGGMERPKDDYKENFDVVISPANTQYGGQVSRLQVAEVIVESILHPEESKNKILELTTKEKVESQSSQPDITNMMQGIPQVA